MMTDNSGDSWCIDLYLANILIKKVGCANFPVRCGATDLLHVKEATGKNYSLAKACLDQKCSSLAIDEEMREWLMLVIARNALVEYYSELELTAEAQWWFRPAKESPAPSQWKRRLATGAGQMASALWPGRRALPSSRNVAASNPLNTPWKKKPASNKPLIIVKNPNRTYDAGTRKGVLSLLRRSHCLLRKSGCS